MNAQVKDYLRRLGKNSLYTLLVTLPAPLMWPQTFHFHDRAGLIEQAKLFGALVLGREFAVVILPRLAAAYNWLLKWSQTNGTPDAT